MNELERFSTNLRLLCAHYQSASYVAREININRHQFEKYLRGKAMPSPHIRQRIAHFFGFKINDLLNAFLNDDQITNRPRADGVVEKQFSFNPSAQELARLRNYIGMYNVYFKSPTAPNMTHVGAAVWREVNGAVSSRFFIRSKSPEFGINHRTKLSGNVLMRGERIYLLEYSMQKGDRFSQTILLPSHGDKGRFLFGMSLGLTWHPKSEPFASRTVWKKAPPLASIRDVMRSCGFFQAHSNLVDPIVAKFLTSDTAALLMMDERTC